MRQNYLPLCSTSPFLLELAVMSLPTPLSTLTYVTVGHTTAKCSACRDNLGRPLPFSKNGVRRHLNSATHLANVKTLTTIQTRTAAQQPKNTRPRAEADVEDTNLGFWNTPSLVPQPELPSVSHEEFLSVFQCLGAPQDTPTANDELASASDDLFDDCITHGQRAPDQYNLASDCEHQSEFSEFGSDSEEEGQPFRPPSISSTPRTQYKTQPNPSPDEWFPYASFAMYLADLLFSSRRLSFSREQMWAILEFARATGGQNIPTLSALRKTQDKLKARVGDPTHRHVSPNGTAFHLNKISETLKQDMANPHLRPHMNFIPHVEGKHMSQAWHAFKMVHDVSDHVLTPSVRFGGHIYYVNELVRRKNDYFLPLRWITYGPSKQLYAIGYHTSESPLGLLVHNDKRMTVRVSTFLETFPEMLQRGAAPVFSGNTSKQWNKHWSCYLSNASLPREILQAEYNVRFVATSPHATPSEMMHGIRSSIDDAFNNPTVAFDCLNQEEVLIRPFPLFWAGDNPMQAEHCSSSGLASNKFCRTCEVGGDTNFKLSAVGYRSLFQPGVTRSAIKTRQIIEERLDMVLKPRMIQKVKDHVSDSGIKDPIAQPLIDRLLALGKDLLKPDSSGFRRTVQEVEDILKVEVATARRVGFMSPLLDMEELGGDIHLDTPTEILHTILLGVVKYFWAQSVFVLEKAKKLDILESRLASVNTVGLDIPELNAAYICQYRGSLIGRHFKAIVQVMPFVVYDLFPGNRCLIDAWLLLGRMTSMLWYTTIDDIDMYTNELRDLIQDFLLVTASCSPSIMILKPKFHFLVHLPGFIRRFGPALLFSTERFESFNSVFRAASMFSNRQAPSRDIARRFANIERAKHEAFGRKKGDGKLIGLPKPNKAIPGSVHTRAKPNAILWMELAQGVGASHLEAPGGRGDYYILAVSMISQSGDTLRAGSDILLKDQSFGHVRSIFVHKLANDNTVDYVLIERYTLAKQKHPLLDMPMVSRSGTLAYVPAVEVECLVNLQHDCATSRKCECTKITYEIQERERTSRVLLRVNHSDQVHFIINIHALHNSLRLRRAISPELHLRKALSLDKEEIFSAAIEKMKTNRAEKARIAAAKKAAKAMVEEVVRGAGAGDVEDAGNVGDTDDVGDAGNAGEAPVMDAPQRKRKSDEDRGEHLQFEEGSETSSNVDEHEDQPGPAGQAAPITGSAFDHIDLSRVAAAPALLVFAEGCCEEYRLPAIAKEDVMRTASLPGANFMTMRLYALMKSMGQDATKTQVDDFLKSNTFKENIKRRIQGGLLDPNIPYYVCGSTARFVRHMRENPASYEIPQVVQEGLMTTKKFSSAVGEILSGFRGELRRKIFGSIEDKTDIASTSEKLAIQGFQISEDHLKRFALLRQLSEDYIKAEAQAQAKKAAENAQAGARARAKKTQAEKTPQKALAFWTYIDSQMNRFFKYPAARRSEILKQILRKDRNKYPDHTGQARWYPPASKLVVSQWQADASYAIQAMAVYTLTAAQEGQEAPLSESGAPGEGEGPGNGETPPEEEEGTLGGDEDDQDAQDGAGTNGDQEDFATLSGDESTRQRPENRHTSDSPRGGPTDPRVTNNSASNHGTPGNNSPRRSTQRSPSDSVGPIRGTPGPQDTRVTTLAQTSRGSPFPPSSRTATLRTPRALTSGTPNVTSGGRVTRSGAQRLPVAEPYNPVDSETAAASVGT
ncbi:Dynein heavy chain, cytoplasmic [Rhizoctonia solani]|uniref:Dynein heavy chain, cytoplasmic n=1 Tax=Rhizoctonia solani TaxID=456999 RepID=A0A0K6GB63_9AGAM|nr:Dynein heavy chain, cytoplasmic [Rhizoctonia solani]